jgi:hypothetical protein
MPKLPSRRRGRRTCVPYKPGHFFFARVYFTEFRRPYLANRARKRRESVKCGRSRGSIGFRLLIGQTI